jgi:hypothetical protein
VRSNLTEKYKLIKAVVTYICNSYVIVPVYVSKCLCIVLCIVL